MAARRRRSASSLPRAPLELVHPLALPAAALSGVEVLEELPSAWAVPALRVLRAVLGWSGGAAAALDPAALASLERELLSPPPGEDGPWAPLALLAGVLARPGEADAERVAWACVCVAEWALDAGAHQTALAFARTAALAFPQQARYAWLVGRLLRGQGMLRDSEAWLRRAHRVGVWTDDWEAQARTLTSMGRLHHEVGRFGIAKRLNIRAVHVAQRHRMRELEGVAQHNLFALHADCGEVECAEAAAKEAFKSYGPHHPHLPMFLHDVAQFWVEQGYHWRALPVFELLLHHFTEPEARLRVSAGAARASGAAGNRQSFARHAAEALNLVDDGAQPSMAATALYEVGIGASSLGDWSRAYSTLQHASEFARQAGVADVALKAEDAMSRIIARDSLEKLRFIPDSSDGDTPSDEFVLQIAESLAANSPKGRGAVCSA
jgi:tetratricopeptide (TPR) repeat protein